MKINTNSYIITEVRNYILGRSSIHESSIKILILGYLKASLMAYIVFYMKQ